MSKKKYYIRINCVAFHDYVVNAKNKKDAVGEAERVFSCDSTEGEFGEFLKADRYFSGEELEVYYPEPNPPSSMGGKNE